MASQSQSQSQAIHQKWKQWIEEMDKHMKYDVSLYRMKNCYEKTLDHPRLFPNQQILGDLDMVMTHITNYDGGVIGGGGCYEVLENTMYGDGVDIKDSDIYSRQELERKEMDMKTNIKTIIERQGHVRVGIYYKENNSCPQYYVLSTEQEDTTYYTKCDYNMYDSHENMLYYMVRYDISSNCYYMLAGMSDWVEEGLEIPVVKSPEDIDEIEQIRHEQEHSEGCDLDHIYHEIKDIENINNWSVIRSLSLKYGLSRKCIEFIYEKKF